VYELSNDSGLLPSQEAKIVEVQLANAEGLRVPGYVAKPLPIFPQKNETENE
jgi:hypothetical protein